jgi:hypothetical protein
MLQSRKKTSAQPRHNTCIPQYTKHAHSQELINQNVLTSNHYIEAVRNFLTVRTGQHFLQRLFTRRSWTHGTQHEDIPTIKKGKDIPVTGRGGP